MEGKKLCLFVGLALAAGLFLVSSPGATERCVLAEMFTSTM
jgi:hypothetical protein